MAPLFIPKLSMPHTVSLSDQMRSLVKAEPVTLGKRRGGGGSSSSAGGRGPSGSSSSGSSRPASGNPSSSSRLSPAGSKSGPNLAPVPAPSPNTIPPNGPTIHKSPAPRPVPAPKPVHKPAPKSESKPEAKSGSKSESEPSPKPALTTAPKSGSKPEKPKSGGKKSLTPGIPSKPKNLPGTRPHKDAPTVGSASGSGGHKDPGKGPSCNMKCKYALVGTFVGLAIILGLVILVFWLHRRRKRRTKKGDGENGRGLPTEVVRGVPFTMSREDILKVPKSHSRERSTSSSDNPHRPSLQGSERRFRDSLVPMMAHKSRFIGMLPGMQGFRPTESKDERRRSTSSSTSSRMRDHPVIKSEAEKNAECHRESNDESSRILQASVKRPGEEYNNPAEEQASRTSKSRPSSRATSYHPAKEKLDTLEEPVSRSSSSGRSSGLGRPREDLQNLDQDEDQASGSCSDSHDNQR